MRLSLFALVVSLLFGCIQGPQGEPGVPGISGRDGVDNHIVKSWECNDRFDPYEFRYSYSQMTSGDVFITGSVEYKGHTTQLTSFRAAKSVGVITGHLTFAASTNDKNDGGYAGLDDWDFYWETGYVRVSHPTANEPGLETWNIPCKETDY